MRCWVGHCAAAARIGPQPRVRVPLLVVIGIELHLDVDPSLLDTDTTLRGSIDFTVNNPGTTASAMMLMRRTDAATYVEKDLHICHLR
jgi:hypothetical protein